MDPSGWRTGSARRSPAPGRGSSGPGSRTAGPPASGLVCWRLWGTPGRPRCCSASFFSVDRPPRPGRRSPRRPEARFPAPAPVHPAGLAASGESVLDTGEPRR
jgi:hypothetical protein